MEALVDVVDQHRAATCAEACSFRSTSWTSITDPSGSQVDAQHSVAERMDVGEALTATSVNDNAEDQDMRETLVIGGVWDVSPLDQGHGFVE